MDTRTIRNVTKLFAIAGGAIPIMLMSIKTMELYINNQKVPYASLYGFYLWPSSIFLIGGSNVSVTSALFLLMISVFANVLLYTIIGFVAASVCTLNSTWSPKLRR